MINKDSVSFIIPHKGRESMLIDTLASIANLETQHCIPEIILVSQNDVVSEQVKLAAGSVPLTVLRGMPDKTISDSRNQGASHSTSDYFAFIDADIGLSSNWLDTLLNILKTRPNTKLVSAMQVAGDNAPPLEEIRTALSNAEVDVAVSFLPGRNLLLHRDTFFAVGQFPTHLITCEDYYFTDKVNELGDLFYSSAATYIHIGEDKDYGALYAKEVWRGQSNLASVKGRHIPLREIPSFVVPFAIPSCLLLALLCLVSPIPVLAIVFLALGLLPFLAYSLRLWKLVRPKASLLDVVKFYGIYFPARVVGTLGGLFKTFGTNTHAK